ncbi:hypothetical protein ABPG74_008228 [Tetrahymena malaccensis]
MLKKLQSFCNKQNYIKKFCLKLSRNELLQLAKINVSKQKYILKAINNRQYNYSQNLKLKNLNYTTIKFQSIAVLTKQLTNQLTVIQLITFLKQLHKLNNKIQNKNPNKILIVQEILQKLIKISQIHTKYKLINQYYNINNNPVKQYILTIQKLLQLQTSKFIIYISLQVNSVQTNRKTQSNIPAKLHEPKQSVQLLKERILFHLIYSLLITQAPFNKTY